MRQAKLDEKFRVEVSRVSARSPLYVSGTDEPERVEADIWIYDEIGMWGISASNFAERMADLTDVEHFTVHLNSPGGEVFDGLAIYNLLRKHKAHVKVEIDGVAASIASIIAMAGDEITIAENALMMIHDPWTVAMGDAADMLKTAELLEKIKGSLVGTYRQKTKQSAKVIEAAMSEETWYTATEAVEFGLADRTTEESAVSARAIYASREMISNGFVSPNGHQGPPPEDWLAQKDFAIRIAKAM